MKAGFPSVTAFQALLETAILFDLIVTLHDHSDYVQQTTDR